MPAETTSAPIEPFKPVTVAERINVTRGYIGMELVKGRMTGDQSAALNRLIASIEDAHHMEMHGQG